MSRVDINVKDRDYPKLISFLNENNCEILIDHKMRIGHMMTIKTPNSDLSWDIISNSYLNQNKEDN
jgi:hypothetical protein